MEVIRSRKLDEEIELFAEPEEDVFVEQNPETGTVRLKISDQPWGRGVTIYLTKRQAISLSIAIRSCFLERIKELGIKVEDDDAPAVPAQP